MSEARAAKWHATGMRREGESSGRHVKRGAGMMVHVPRILASCLTLRLAVRAAESAGFDPALVLQIPERLHLSTCRGRLHAPRGTPVRRVAMQTSPSRLPLRATGLPLPFAFPALRSPAPLYIRARSTFLIPITVSACSFFCSLLSCPGASPLCGGERVDLLFPGVAFSSVLCIASVALEPLTLELWHRSFRRISCLLPEALDVKMETKPKPKHTLPLKSLNHVSRVCRDVNATTNFYEDVLGFIPIKRPGSFDFDGTWLHNYGISVHLLQAEKEEVEILPPVKEVINPRDDHLSFQSDSVEMVEQALQYHDIKYEKNTIDENGIVIEQVFFHDPDGFMIEICTCEKFPVQPLNGATAELCNLVRTLSRRKSGIPTSRPISRANTGDKLNILDQLKAC